MLSHEQELRRGLGALRLSLAQALGVLPAPAPAGAGGMGAGGLGAGWLLSDAFDPQPAFTPPHPRSGSQPQGAASSEQDQAVADRVVALVELARGGDAEAFGQLYDHYRTKVYRFVYYRVGSTAVAEDLTSETFFRALRSMGTFQWQGKDFGAWLMTIARNLTTDHFKAGRTRLELSTDDMTAHVDAGGSTDGPDTQVLSSLTNQALLGALKTLPHEQQECLIMRFLQGLSIAETALVLGRSAGAVKQLQLRGIRNLAKSLPEGVR
jgi:RNA polymerase sigma-70 factor (ECF subfamily)